MGWTFTAWYQQNGDALNERRRNRYETDPDYKDKVLRQNRESRRRKKLKDAEIKKLTESTKEPKKKITKESKEMDDGKQVKRKKGARSGVRAKAVRKVRRRKR